MVFDSGRGAGGRMSQRRLILWILSHISFFESMKIPILDMEKSHIFFS